MARPRALSPSYHALWKRQRAAYWKAHGGCPRCGQPREKFQTCQACRHKATLAYRRRLAKGPGRICASCGKRKPSALRATCRSCASRVNGVKRCATAKRHPVWGYLVGNEA